MAASKRPDRMAVTVKDPFARLELSPNPETAAVQLAEHFGGPRPAERWTLLVIHALMADELNRKLRGEEQA